MTDEPILKRRLDPGTIAKKTVGTIFNNFTLNDIKISSWTKRIQDLYTWMAIKNIVEWEKYMIL